MFNIKYFLYIGIFVGLTLITFNLNSFLTFSTQLLSPAQPHSLVRINALGDSITGSPGCWRGLVWKKLQAAGITHTDFVGTLEPEACGFAYDGQHDGRPTFQAIQIAASNELPDWLAISQPDIVQMQLGTNDVWNNFPPASIIEALDRLVDQMRDQKPTMRILVAQITPMQPLGCPDCPPCDDCPARVDAYNAAIAVWAPGKATTESPITVVDCFTGYDTALDTSDGVHPNANGNKKLAQCWYEPLKEAILLTGGIALPARSSGSTTFSLW